MSLRAAARSILAGILAFVIFTILLFLYWKHFSIDYLVAAFINPHSLVPRSVQVQAAEHYLHLDLPFYQQYFGFMSNFFTGRWAYSQFYNPIDSGYYTFQVHPVISNLLPTTLFIMIAGSLISILLIRLSPGKVSSSGKTGHAFTRVLLILSTAVGVPLILRFLVAGISTIYSPAGILLSGPGYSILHSATQNWTTTYIQGVLIHTSPTGVPFIDALINSSIQDSLYLLRQMAVIILSTAFVLFISAQLLKKTYSGEENLIQRFGYYLVFALVFSTAFTEYIFNFFGGTGYYAGFLNPVSRYFTVYVPPEYDVWLQVYLLLTYGIIITVLSVCVSLLKSRNR